MRKMRLLNIVIFILLLILTTSCKNKYDYKKFDAIEKENIKIVVTSDLHFLSKTMIEEGSRMLKENYYGDGRIICYNEELIDAFIYQMLKEKPDVVIITGDLTYDGSYQNHLELTKKLEKLVNQDIRVLVIPGNHDLNNATSKKYLAKGTEKTPHLTAKQYEKMYYNFGRGNAMSIDKDSYSYYYQISNDLGIIMIDDNYYDMKGDTSLTYIGGRIKKSTFEWLEKTLKVANEKGIDIIIGSHHNLFQHSTLFISNYQISDHEKLKNLLNKYEVKLYLSGHMHIQHQNSESGITEVLTGALSITPHQYGVVDYYANGNLIYDYYTNTVNVETYAKEMNIIDDKLLNFAEYSKTFYAESSYLKTYEQIMFNDSSLHLQAEASGNLLKKLNPPYFAGVAFNIIDEIVESEDYKLLKNYSDSSYIDSIIEGSEFDYRFLKIYREVVDD